MSNFKVFSATLFISSCLISFAQAGGPGSEEEVIEFRSSGTRKNSSATNTECLRCEIPSTIVNPWSDTPSRAISQYTPCASLNHLETLQDVVSVSTSSLPNPNRQHYVLEQIIPGTHLGGFRWVSADN